MATIDNVKTSLNPPITTTDFDSYLTDLISAAKLDLGIAGVSLPTTLDTLCEPAIITYCAYHWEQEHGSIDRAARFKSAYDEQKSQLGMATGYTNWGVTS